MSALRETRHHGAIYVSFPSALSAFRISASIRRGGADEAGDDKHSLHPGSVAQSQSAHFEDAQSALFNSSLSTQLSVVNQTVMRASLHASEIRVSSLCVLEILCAKKNRIASNRPGVALC